MMRRAIIIVGAMSAAVMLAACGGSSTTIEISPQSSTPSSTAASVLVPTVIGKQQGDAETIIGDAGFEVEVHSVPNSASSGTVLEQDPVAGSRADEGATVTLTVSSGRP